MAEPTIDQAKADALWQRVRQTLPLSFGAMAHREGRIVRCCRELYRLGLHRQLLSRLYRDARQRKQLLLAMAKLESEPDWLGAIPPEEPGLATLQRLLGLAATDYKVSHPVYGQVLEGFSRDCAAAQRALLGLV